MVIYRFVNIASVVLEYDFICIIIINFHIFSAVALHFKLWVKKAHARSATLIIMRAFLSYFSETRTCSSFAVLIRGAVVTPWTSIFVAHRFAFRVRASLFPVSAEFPELIVRTGVFGEQLCGLQEIVLFGAHAWVFLLVVDVAVLEILVAPVW